MDREELFKVIERARWDRIQNVLNGGYPETAKQIADSIIQNQAKILKIGGGKK